MRRLLFLGLVSAGVFGLRSALGWLVLPTDWPVDRLLENLGRYVEEHRTEPEGRYCLGRIHCYAFVFQTDQIAAFGPRERDRDPSQRSPEELESLVASTSWQESSLRSSDRIPTARIGPEEALGHLTAGLRLLREAVGLAPERAHYHLSLAYLVEKGAHLADHVDTLALFEIEPVETTDWRRQQIRERIAALGSDDEARAEKALEETLTPDWFEASLPFLDRQRTAANPGLQARVARLLERWWLERSIASYRRAFELAIDGDRNAVVVHDSVALEAGQGLLRLIPRVGLRGEEVERFAAEVAAAVKELEAKPTLGSIGAELAGIAVWFDRDSDGLSDPGEVVPVEELGIAALATRATAAVGRSLANFCGLELRDGRVLPTYDWVLEPVSAPVAE